MSEELKQSESSGEKAYIIDTRDESKIIGNGAFATVYKVSRRHDLMPFAAKIYHTPVDRMSALQVKGKENELKILKTIKHPLVIEYVEEFILDRKLCIVSCFATMGDLESLI